MSQPDARTPDAASRLQRDLELLRQCARVSAPLREAVDRVEQELQRYEIARQEDAGRIDHAVSALEAVKASEVVDLYGLRWAKDGHYYAAAEALGIEEPSDG